MNDAPFLIGQTLVAGETPARGIRRLTRPQQRALRLCLSAPGRLDAAGTRGWRHPISIAVTVDRRTVASLAREGLLVIVSRGRFQQHARLTRRGDWYARTLVTEAMRAVRHTIEVSA